MQIQYLKFMLCILYIIDINNEAGEVDPPRARGLTSGFLGNFFLRLFVFVCDVHFFCIRLVSLPFEYTLHRPLR